MKLFIIFLFLLSLISCVVGTDENSTFRDRGRTETKPRAIPVNNEETPSSQSPQSPQSPQPESSNPNKPSNQESPQQPKTNKKLIFPVDITSNLKSLQLDSNDNQEIRISGMGEEMTLLASQSGSVFIGIFKNSYHLKILGADGYTINLLLRRTKSILKVDSDYQIEQGQAIAQTRGEAVYYITKDYQKLILCLSNITASIPIINNLDLENCDN